MSSVARDDFESLSKDRFEIMQRLAEDDDLCRCLLSNRLDFKKHEFSEADRESLPWNYIYPCRYLGDTQISAKSFISMQFSYAKSKTSNIWKVGTITLYLICHKELIRTQYGVLRYDYMLQRVNYLLNDTRNDTWLGKLNLSQLDEVVYDTAGNYVGLRARYTCTEQM